MAEAKVNRLNLTEKDYDGAPSTMCRGCGHDAISASVQRAYFESSIDPRKVVKLSGIGCSSRLPGYMTAHGFNSIHGRALPIATGLKLARPELELIVTAGDGDIFSIGAGHLVATVRRNPPITLMVMDNGVYGLTKGQQSPTTPPGSSLRGGAAATQQQLASELGTAREVVSRILSEFQRRGWVAPARGNIAITNRPALERLAEEH